MHLKKILLILILILVILGVIFVSVKYCLNYKKLNSNKNAGTIEYCSDKLLESCDGKMVALYGTINEAKGYDVLCNISDREIKYWWVKDCVAIENNDIVTQYKKSNINYKQTFVNLTGIVTKGGEKMPAEKYSQAEGARFPTTIKVKSIKDIIEQ